MENWAAGCCVEKKLSVMDQVRSSVVMDQSYLDA